MYLTLDRGNTRLKAAVFDHHEIQESWVDPSPQQLLEAVNQWSVTKAIISSVGGGEAALVRLLEPTVEVSVLTTQLAVPIRNLYQSPRTLGTDRLAAVVGAKTCHPGMNCLVIDAGTSITYDLLDETGSYHGGGISPGIDLRYQALNDYTNKLPLVNNKDPQSPLIGVDTESSISSGVLHGSASEIEGLIRRYGDKFPNLKVLMCGGDAAFFESMLKASIFVVPHLVLIGLNAILLHHAKD